MIAVLILVAVVFCHATSWAALVTIDNTRPKLDTNGDIVDAKQFYALEDFNHPEGNAEWADTEQSYYNRDLPRPALEAHRLEDGSLPQRVMWHRIPVTQHQSTLCELWCVCSDVVAHKEI